jgi:hypothetical protein
MTEKKKKLSLIRQITALLAKVTNDATTREEKDAALRKAIELADKHNIEPADLPAGMTQEELALWAALWSYETGSNITGPWVLLDDVEIFLGRFIAYPSDHARVAHVLWCIHAHIMDAWNSTPRLAFLSAERGSGKTRALEVTALLVPKPIQSINCTPNYIARKIASTRPTILYDEIDCLFGSKIPDSGEVRALLNAGHRPGAVTGRCVIRGKRVETEELPAYCAVALAGIGDLPDTIGSRSIIIDMRRRSPEETVEAYRHRYHRGQGGKLRMRIARFADSIAKRAAQVIPVMPEGIVDRDADCWEPLLTVADVVGGDWPERARDAAKALVISGHERTETKGVRLLADLFEIFGSEEALSTKDIIDRLIELPESPWADFCRGKPISERQLADRLKAYQVKPGRIRLSGDQRFRGYHAAELADPWLRYCALSKGTCPTRPIRPNGPWDGSGTYERIEPVPEKTADFSKKTASGTDGTGWTDTTQAEESPGHIGHPGSVPDQSRAGVRMTDSDPFAAFKDPSLPLRPRRRGESSDQPEEGRR